MIAFLQTYGLSGGSIGSVLAQWEQAGVFSYLLPFLLIFAIIFGILQKMNLFGDTSKAVNGIIALAVGLMSLQFGFVSIFFAEIFPKLGMGLAVILLALILLGLFTDSNQTGIMFGLGGIILAVILWNTFDFGGTSFWYWFSGDWISIIAVIVVLAVVGGLIFGAPKAPNKLNDNLLAQAILGPRK